MSPGYDTSEQMRTEKEKMLAGEMYRPGDPEIQADLAATRAWLARYNASLARSSEERHGLLAERLAEVGAGTVIRPPFHCDYGFNIRLGSNVFFNFKCVRNSFENACRKAGIETGSPFGITLHSLRHTAATRLINGNLPIQMVGRILSHQNPQTTYRYLTANNETLYKAASIFESIQAKA